MDYTWHGSTTHMREHVYDEKGHNLPNEQLSENEEGDYEAESTKKQDRFDRALLAFFFYLLGGIQCVDLSSIFIFCAFTL
jgi:hypothetical protein